MILIWHLEEQVTVVKVLRTGRRDRKPKGRHWAPYLTGKVVWRLSVCGLVSGLSRSRSGRRTSLCQEPLTRALRRTLRNQLQNLSGRGPAPGTQLTQRSGSASAWNSRGLHLRHPGHFGSRQAARHPGGAGQRSGLAGRRKCRGFRRREHRALYEFLGFRRWVLYRMASVRHGPWYLIPPLVESLLSNHVPLWASLSPVQKGRPLLGSRVVLAALVGLPIALWEVDSSFNSAQVNLGPQSCVP